MAYNALCRKCGHNRDAHQHPLNKKEGEIKEGFRISLNECKKEIFKTRKRFVKKPARR